MAHGLLSARTMRTLPVALLLFVAACDTRLSGIASGLAVEPGALQFPATATGDSRALPLTLTNRSRAPLELHLSAPEPFALELDVRLYGGESREVPVTFAPASVDVAIATLVVTGDAQASVPVSGEAVAPATCTPSSSCRVTSRDPATNSCVEVNAADGTACSGDNACLTAGHCLAGACLGSARSCDDANACTLDACEPVGGCAHTERVCPAPADKCQVARCDPSSGCLTEAAPDGTSCGPSDCATAHVCMAGACQVRPVPDGYACGDSSPCRDKGRCTAGACAQPPPQPLQLAWSHPMTYGAVDFRGVTDGAGNLYWVECSYVKSTIPCELVSHAPNGLQRFRVGVPNLSPSDTVHHLAAGGSIIVAGEHGAALTAFTESGVMRWSRPHRGGDKLYELAAHRSGRVYTVEVMQGEVEGWTLNAYEPATGQSTGWTLARRAHGLVLDTSGDLYFAVEGTFQPTTTSMNPVPAASLVSLTPAGALRFQVPLSFIDEPEAVLNGELMLRSGALRSTLDGSPRPSSPRQDWGGSGLSPMMAVTHRYRWVGESCCPACDCDLFDFVPEVFLEGFAAGSSTPTFTYGAQAWQYMRISEPQLLSDGSALFASQREPSTDVYLRAIDASGAEKFACLVGSSLVGTQSLRTWRGATALTDGRWAVLEHTPCPSCAHDPPPVLRVYATPGLNVASFGWTGSGGSPGRNGQPR